MLFPLVALFIGGGLLVLLLIGLLAWRVHRQDERYVVHAAGLLRQGLPSDVVLNHLIAGGLDRGTAVALLNRSCIRHLSSQTREAVKQGESAEAARARLQGLGLDPQAAEAIVAAALEANRSVPEQAGRMLGAMLLLAVGAVVVLGGFALFAGNKSGALPTFPYAGSLTMALGGCLIGSAALMAGRRGALVLGTLFVVVGLGVFALGLTREDTVSSVLPIAGILVACLGGGVIALGAGYINQPRR